MEDRLEGQRIAIGLEPDLALEIRAAGGALVWRSSAERVPTLIVRTARGMARVPLASAGQRERTHFAEATYQGYRLGLYGFPTTDVRVELIAALDPAQDDLLLQIGQSGGSDALVAVEHFYCFVKPVSAGGYAVLPHGSGYLVPAQCADPLPGAAPFERFVGARWTMPLFGMVGAAGAWCAVVDTWWDCEVEVEHVPGERTLLDFHWRGAPDRLAYSRRQYLHVAPDGLDYAGMAARYRRRAQQQGLLRPLAEKARAVPALRRQVESILFRWGAWNSQESAAALADVRRLRGMGFELTHFYPKCPSRGYDPDHANTVSTDGGWQSFLHHQPVPGGWETLREYAAAARALGCLLQGFINPRTQVAGAPAYDPDRWPLDRDGHPVLDLSGHDALERTERVLRELEAKGLRFDVLYFDGFAAHYALPQDYSAGHPMTRRRNYEAQSACFAATRQHGIVPGGEMARFWCMAECDYFFFTDWAADRLVDTGIQGAPGPVGIPVPLFQLVFHECYLAGFSGGGYALYNPGYDWWADRQPRLYELLLAAQPAHNWLPHGQAPVRDWDSDEARCHWEWLRRWSGYYRRVALSPMLEHRFLDAEGQRHRIEFGSGVVAEFDMQSGRLRVQGVPEFSGAWEEPPQLT